MDWNDALGDLARQVAAWAREAGLTADVLLPPDPDEPLVEIAGPGGVRIVLEPARFAAGRIPTVAHLYAYPTLRRVRLAGPAGEAWEVQTPQGVPMSVGWDAAAFARLLNVLADDPL